MSEWQEKLKASRAKLWSYQQRLNCFPDVNVGFNFDCWFNLKSPAINRFYPVYMPEPFLHCLMEDYDFQRLIHRDLNFNNASVGMRILFDRRPNVYNPDVTTLLNFFHL